MDQDTAKRAAAREALTLLPESGVVGLGSGSTATFFIQGVAELVRAGRRLTGVATSNESRRLAESLGIEVLPDPGPWPIDLCVDGADEISETLDLIKGGGGCHTREKIVNRAAARNVVVVDESKLSGRLGEKWPVPIEVLEFGHAATRALLERFGQPSSRLRAGAPWITDSGNRIYDLAVGPIDDPARLDRELCQLPGVVGTGLFVAAADLVLVAGEGGVRRLSR